ncbi:MAG: rRNA pseudouridine synthase [Oscillospiraceae bacterium]|nr:rRNA pseudouridine synthase [Oscillospiraceae bacterium]
MALVRMDKLVCTAAGCSRADAKRLLSSGAVTVDGKTIKQGSVKADPDSQTVCIGGKPVKYSEHIYIIMNKPLGVVSSTDDHDGQTVLDILPEQLLRKGLFPAGRLDKYTCGMMIITDDGDFAHRILAPKKHLPKIYQFELDAPILNEQLRQKFLQGVYLGGGEYSSPAYLDIISPTEGRVTIFEGIYHQVRRMFDQNGGHVIALKRIKIGGLPLPDDLAEGMSRQLTDDELKQLFETEKEVL